MDHDSHSASQSPSNACSPSHSRPSQALGASELLADPGSALPVRGHGGWAAQVVRKYELLSADAWMDRWITPHHHLYIVCMHVCLYVSTYVPVRNRSRVLLLDCLLCGSKHTPHNHTHAHTQPCHKVSNGPANKPCRRCNSVLQMPCFVGTGRSDSFPTHVSMCLLSREHM